MRKLTALFVASTLALALRTWLTRLIPLPLLRQMRSDDAPQRKIRSAS
ncbi:Uncharacterised protein [Citrobacter koseri]|uniref:Uncharacterized protein n=1 Tax=Citrobacter koseri TaxID=545 RepID=A0A3S4MAG7_CITKO|nr:Uncharacterised protein [Citrobacter koseri]